MSFSTVSTLMAYLLSLAKGDDFLKMKVADRYLCQALVWGRKPGNPKA